MGRNDAWVYIVGIDVDNQGENLISQVGAIHCITHTIGVADPLWIVHQKIDEAEANTTVPVEAQIKHISGIASASVFWKEETAANWTETAMTAAGTDMWTADITIPNTEENIQYYISAEANSGKTQVRPIVAPEGYWTMNLGGVLNTNSFENAIVAGPFPNPANDTVSFGFDSDIANVQVVVHNVLGQELMNSEYTLDNGSLTVSLPANWSGTLFFSLTTQKGTTVKKVLKQ